MSDLFIPKRIRVGFRDRNDTYTKRLAYVTYYDNKGKLRKETSWEGWRDKKIQPEEYDNVPWNGFVLNKGIQRYGWSHFSSNRSYIRIYDTRGIEFEITPENLIGILMETTCSKRDLDGEFVYAWCGSELVLLPCCSEEYKNALEHTARQDQKVSARDLKAGCSYTTKKNEEVIYLGRFHWFEWNMYQDKGRVCKKMHIFAHPEKPKYGLRFFPKGDVAFLAHINNHDPVQEYASLIDEFQGDIHSSVIVDWEVSPVNATVNRISDPCYPHSSREKMDRHVYLEKVGDLLTFWRVVLVYGGYYNNRRFIGYHLEKEYELNTKTLEYKSHSRNYYGDSCYQDGYRGYNGTVLSEEQLIQRLANFVEVDMVLESGKKIRVKDVGSFTGKG